MIQKDNCHLSMMVASYGQLNRTPAILGQVDAPIGTLDGRLLFPTRQDPLLAVDDLSSSGFSVGRPEGRAGSDRAQGLVRLDARRESHTAPSIAVRFPQDTVT